jgi:hypothetical protein
MGKKDYTTTLDPMSERPIQIERLLEIDRLLRGLRDDKKVRKQTEEWIEQQDLVEN